MGGVLPPHASDRSLHVPQIARWRGARWARTQSAKAGITSVPISSMVCMTDSWDTL